MEPDIDEWHPITRSNLSAACLELPQGQISPLIRFGANGSVALDKKDALYPALRQAGRACGRLVIITRRAAGRTPTTAKPVRDKLGTHGGTAFVVGAPNGPIPGHDDVKVLAITARHCVETTIHFNQYNPQRIFFSPSFHLNLLTIDPDAPEDFTDGRLYPCEIVQIGTQRIPLVSEVNSCSHEVTSDVALLAVRSTAINEAAIVAEDVATLTPTLTNKILVPSVAIFQQQYSSNIAAMGYPGGGDQCRPQTSGTDYDQLFRDHDPLSLPILNSHFGDGVPLVAGFGKLSKSSSLESILANDGFSVVASTGTGMSGGPVLDVGAEGVFVGVVVGSATTSPNSYLLNEILDCLDTTRINHQRLQQINNALSPDIQITAPANWDDHTPYQRREAVLMKVDNARRALTGRTVGSFGQGFTTAELNYNYILGAGGRSFAHIYLNYVVPHINVDYLTPVQREHYKGYLAWVSGGWVLP
ncbi:hypothetical protein HK097_011519 [Rhizophlyctis rosea]|uniref:Uncharacterized protein n=1 Tax=Rhizophlyctis rosea TaxID=64517 RepID=A0AAD5S7Z3_9FUNG|nr:hypothetical protein HK097_011519 [Rhizophlyctis rosea]